MQYTASRPWDGTTTSLSPALHPRLPPIASVSHLICTCTAIQACSCWCCSLVLRTRAHVEWRRNCVVQSRVLRGVPRLRKVGPSAGSAMSDGSEDDGSLRPGRQRNIASARTRNTADILESVELPLGEGGTGSRFEGIAENIRERSQSDSQHSAAQQHRATILRRYVRGHVRCRGGGCRVGVGVRWDSPSAGARQLQWVGLRWWGMSPHFAHVLVFPCCGTPPTGQHPKIDLRDSAFRKTCFPRFNPFWASLVDDYIVIGNREGAACLELLGYFGVTHVRACHGEGPLQRHELAAVACRLRRSRMTTAIVMRALLCTGTRRVGGATRDTALGDDRVSVLLVVAFSVACCCSRGGRVCVRPRA